MSIFVEMSEEDYDNYRKIKSVPTDSLFDFLEYSGYRKLSTKEVENEREYGFGSPRIWEEKRYKKQNTEIIIRVFEQ